MSVRYKLFFTCSLSKSAIIVELERIIGAYKGKQADVLLIAMGGIHGNEPAGIRALQRVFKRLEAEKPEFKGHFIGVAGNLVAIKEKKRFVELDLNRQWYPEKVEQLSRTSKSELNVVEDIEQKEMLLLFEDMIQKGNYTSIVHIDLHTTSAKGGTYCIATQTTYSEELALQLHVPVILGMEKVFKGTTMHYFSDKNIASVCFEAGQHNEIEAIDRMEAALWKLLQVLDCLSAKTAAIMGVNGACEATLRRAGENLPRKVQFCYRHPIKATDHFKMRAGYKNFQPIEKGEILANDKDGVVRSPHKGLILMPLYQAQGSDGFFIVTEE